MAYRDLHCFAALSAGHTSAIKHVRRTTTWRRLLVTTAPFLCNHVDACAYVSCMCGWAGVHIEWGPKNGGSGIFFVHLSLEINKEHS